MISTIIIVIICFSIIIHHLYKVKDELNDIKEKLNEISNYQTKYYEHLYNLLYPIDGCVEDIEDKVDGTNVLLADGIKEQFIESFKKAMEE